MGSVCSACPVRAAVCRTTKMRGGASRASTALLAGPACAQALTSNENAAAIAVLLRAIVVGANVYGAIGPSSSSAPEVGERVLGARVEHRAAVPV